MQRLAGDLRDRIPDRDFDGADADRALAVAAGFLPLHHGGEDFLRREVLAGVVEQRCRIGRQDARDEARAHLRAAGIAAGRIEREARDRLAVADDVGDHRHHRGGHLGEIEARIADVRVERNRAFANVDNTHPDVFRRSSTAGRCVGAAVRAPFGRRCPGYCIAGAHRHNEFGGPSYSVSGGQADRSNGEDDGRSF